MPSKSKYLSNTRYRSYRKPPTNTPLEVPSCMVDEQRQAIGATLDTVLVHKIKCFVCKERDVVYDLENYKAAELLLKRGWRFLFSAKLDKRGIMCPECSSISDDSREEK
jgi:hypothetical protein